MIPNSLEQKYEFLVGGQGGPELWLSTMLGGTSDFFKKTRVRTERDAFNIKEPLRPNVTSVHGILNQTRESIIQTIVNGEIPFNRRAHRLLLRQWMSPLERTISEMNGSEQKRFLILHPETAEWLTQQIEKGKISLEPQVTVLVENDDIDGGTFHLERHYPDAHPGDPKLVRSVVDRMSRVIDREVGTVLDVDHLLAASRVSVSDAAQILQPKYLHLSGPSHHGYSPIKIFHYAEIVKPDILVLEGPIPAMHDIAIDRVSERHKERLNILVYDVTRGLLNLD